MGSLLESVSHHLNYPSVCLLMMSSPRLDMVIASRVFEEVTTEFGLTLSIA